MSNNTTTNRSFNVLSDANIIYLILYVHDLDESRTFYEKKLGLKLIESDEGVVKFDGGMVIICLHSARDYGVTLPGRSDDASDIVFLVDDINVARESLEKRGVIFVRRRTYEIGLVTDFYDPNGHRLMIYQPSETALSWPSGDKLRTIWAACGRGGSELIGPPAVLQDVMDSDSDTGLNGKPLIYLFLFVPDSGEALSFYQNDLGLIALERVHCCNPACPPEEKGIVKYDGGGLLLSTHHIHQSPVVDDFGKVYSPRTLDPSHIGGIVPVFMVHDIDSVFEKLSHNGVSFEKGTVRSHIGRIAKFHASTGHLFFLYEPAQEALLWPGGKKIEEIESFFSHRSTHL